MISLFSCQSLRWREDSFDGNLVGDLVPVSLVVARVLASVDRSELEEPQALVGLAASGAGARATTRRGGGGRGRGRGSGCGGLVRRIRLRGRGRQRQEVLGEGLDLTEALGSRRRRHLDGIYVVEIVRP